MTPFPSAYDIDDETRQDKTRQDYAPPSSSSEPASSFLLLSCHGPQVIVAPFFYSCLVVSFFLHLFWGWGHEAISHGVCESGWRHEESGRVGYTCFISCQYAEEIPHVRGSAGGKFIRIHTLLISFPRCIQCSSKRHGGPILRFKTLGPMAVIIHDARRIVQ
jgi:hypothetical protein